MYNHVSCLFVSSVCSLYMALDNYQQCAWRHRSSWRHHAVTWHSAAAAAAGELCDMGGAVMTDQPALTDISWCSRRNCIVNSAYAGVRLTLAIWSPIYKIILRFIIRLSIRFSQDRLNIVTYNVLRLILGISQANLWTLSQTILRYCKWIVPKKSFASFVRCSVN